MSKDQGLWPVVASIQCGLGNYLKGFKGPVIMGSILKGGVEEKLNPYIKVASYMWR